MLVKPKQIAIETKSIFFIIIKRFVLIIVQLFANKLNYQLYYNSAIF